jgi:hypothetical protein
MATRLIPFVLFAALASPAAFKATRGILGGWIAGTEGLPTFPGLLLHALVFILVVGFLMKHIRKSGYTKECADGKCYKFETADDQDDQNTRRYQDDRFIFDGSI